MHWGNLTEMKNAVYLIMFVLLVLGTFFLSGCARDIGSSCTTNDECYTTRNCSSGVCVASGLGGYCLQDYHCTLGLCKGNTCQLGDYKDLCTIKEDCKAGLTCYKGECVKDTFLCSIGREMSDFFGLLFLVGLIVFGLGIILAVLQIHVDASLTIGPIIIGGMVLIGLIVMILSGFGMFGVYC